MPRPGRLESDEFSSYSEYEIFAACHGFGEHCAQKWGNPVESHPLGLVNTQAGGEISAENTLVSIPYPNSAKSLASSLEASMLARVRSIFYSYPAELIARWCGITLGSARLYKNNRRKPSRTVLRLFTLHRDERVMGAEWQGWRIRGNTIVDPDGNATTVDQLTAYWLVMQLASELVKNSPQARAEFEKILRRA